MATATNRTRPENLDREIRLNKEKGIEDSSHVNLDGQPSLQEDVHHDVHTTKLGPHLQAHPEHDATRVSRFK